MCVSDIIETPTRSILTSAGGLEFSVKNSSGAIESIRSGKADLAIVAIPDGAKLPEDLHCTPFAFDVAMVVVNNGNPLQQTDLHTLTALLSATAESGDKWGAFGLKDVWADRKIAVYLPGSSNGMTLQLLRSQTVRDGKFREDFVYMTGRENPDVLVREQPECLMVIRGIKVPQTGRALLISKEAGADAFAYPPSESSVFYGDYPLRLPFYIVTKTNAPKVVADLEAFLLSNEAAEKLTAAGYVPVPKSERAEN